MAVPTQNSAGPEENERLLQFMPEWHEESQMETVEVGGLGTKLFLTQSSVGDLKLFLKDKAPVIKLLL